MPPRGPHYSKADIVDRISAKTGLPKAEANRMLDAFLGEVSALLDAGEGSITLRSFGRFDVQHLQQRNISSPMTDGTVLCPPTRRLRFRPSPKQRRQEKISCLDT